MKNFDMISFPRDDLSNQFKALNLGSNHGDSAIKLGMKMNIDRYEKGNYSSNFSCKTRA